MNMDIAIPHKPGAIRTLLAALVSAFQHWRWLVLVWIASLLPALLMNRPIARLIETAIGPYPDAARIVTENDLALLIDALMTHSDAGGNPMASILPGIGFGLLLGVLLAPWISGMLIASLRERRVLGFSELWLGGWREYGRQFRLWLVALIPWALAGGIAMLASAWAGHGAEDRILESVGQQRERAAQIISVIALLLAYANIESARAAFAADANLRSAFHAWLRGLCLIWKRPFASLLIVIVTVVSGLALTVAAQTIGLHSGSNASILTFAQLTVLAVAWLRFVRITGLRDLAVPGNMNKCRFR